MIYMKCTNCGVELRDGAVFCSKCGTKVTANYSVNNEPDSIDSSSSLDYSFAYGNKKTSKNKNNNINSISEFLMKMPRIVYFIAAIFVGLFILFFIKKTVFNIRYSGAVEVASVAEQDETGFYPLVFLKQTKENDTYVISCVTCPSNDIPTTICNVTIDNNVKNSGKIKKMSKGQLFKVDGIVNNLNETYSITNVTNIDIQDIFVNLDSIRNNYLTRDKCGTRVMLEGIAVTDCTKREAEILSGKGVLAKKKKEVVGYELTGYYGNQKVIFHFSVDNEDGIPNNNKNLQIVKELKSGDVVDILSVFQLASYNNITGYNTYSIMPMEVEKSQIKNDDFDIDVFYYLRAKDDNLDTDVVEYSEPDAEEQNQDNDPTIKSTEKTERDLYLEEEFREMDERAEAIDEMLEEIDARHDHEYAYFKEYVSSENLDGKLLEWVDEDLSPLLFYEEYDDYSDATTGEHISDDGRKVRIEKCKHFSGEYQMIVPYRMNFIIDDVYGYQMYLINTMADGSEVWYEKDYDRIFLLSKTENGYSLKFLCGKEPAEDIYFTSQ